MRLTWKDGVTTVSMGLVTAAYLAFLIGADMPIVDTVRGTTAAVLILGWLGGCVFGGFDNTGKTGLSRFLIGLASVFGVTAFAAGIVGLVAANAVALAVLFGATAALWLTATARHAFAAEADTAPLGPRTHEVIDPTKQARR